MANKLIEVEIKGTRISYAETMGIDGDEPSLLIWERDQDGKESVCLAEINLAGLAAVKGVIDLVLGGQDNENG